MLSLMFFTQEIPTYQFKYHFLKEIFLDTSLNALTVAVSSFTTLIELCSYSHVIIWLLTGPPPLD